MVQENSRLDASLRNYLLSLCNKNISDTELRELIRRFSTGMKPMADIEYDGSKKISNIKNININKDGKISYGRSARVEAKKMDNKREEIFRALRSKIHERSG
jgi:hypothetical protein